MFELAPENAASYLASRPEIAPGPWRITPLGGGVSNTVLLVESGAGRFVMKQSLARLRVAEEWLSDRGRIRRECAAIRALSPHLPPGALPAILFEDAPNCLFAMSAAADGSDSWKGLLLKGDTRNETAEQVAAMLAAMIRVSWQSPQWREAFGDQTVFDQLRLDPYYRFTASRHPDLAECFLARIGDCRRRRCSAVHGDWSPKNFLVAGSAIMAIDFEVIHYGDPSFDAAFLLNHLLLKSFHRPQWAPRYAELARRFWKILETQLPDGRDWFEQATVEHLGCLLLARIDGKSPAEYLKEDAIRAAVRDFARRIIRQPPAAVSEVFAMVPG